MHLPEAPLASGRRLCRIVRFARNAQVFAQGSPAHSVFYIREGTIKLSVVSPAGRETVVAVLGRGDFFGEGCLAGRRRRMASAFALVPTAALSIPKGEMRRTLHDEAAFCDRFIAHMLVRNIRIEEDLVDQLFDCSEKRLARALLVLAGYGSKNLGPQPVVPKPSQKTLAELTGASRSRVKFFMNKFRKLGFIEYDGGLTINSSLLRIILHD